MNPLQDEKYSHIEKEDMAKVEKCLKEKEAWRDSKTNAQNQKALHQDPVVTAAQIRSEIQVRRSRKFYFSKFFDDFRVVNCF